MERRQHDRLARPGRRQSDHRLPTVGNRRVLLVGQEKVWSLLTAYAFEEVGYTVSTVDNWPQAVAVAMRLLPDVVVVQMEASDTLDMLAQWSELSNTADIPVVVLTASLRSIDAGRERAAGGVTLLAHADDVDVLVGEVDTLIAAAPRAQRALKRRLLDLQEIAQTCAQNADGQARLRRLIDRLQVAIFAVDDEGHCIAASQGATMLTGYSRRQLLKTSVFQSGFAGGQVSDERWRHFLANRQYTGTTQIINRAGEEVTVHAAAVAEILPGLHVAALVAA
jgi:PAS domain S-box-containing protein